VRHFVQGFAMPAQRHHQPFKISEPRL
jgi:hypothetical protein